MAATTIEWTQRVWNPVTGCTKVSPGCANCYAERMAKRLHGRYGYPRNNPFAVTLHEDRLEEPLRRKKPTTYFVCSMGDLFHVDVPFEFVERVFEAMYMAPHHTYQILTKRPEQMCESVSRLMAPSLNPQMMLANIWPGTSCENQATADERIPHLLKCPAAVRFLSFEPLLGPADLDPDTHHTDCVFSRVESARQRGECNCDGGCENYEPGERWLEKVHWVIVGGESGPGARPMHPDWVRSIRDQCVAAGVAFFFKGWGEWAPLDAVGASGWSALTDSEYRGRSRRGRGMLHGGPYDGLICVHAVFLPLVRIGKKRAGRILDGRTWDEMPNGYH